jgi:hypothetical protein
VAHRSLIRKWHVRAISLYGQVIKNCRAFSLGTGCAARSNIRQVLAEIVDNFLPAPIADIFLKLFEGNVNDIVMMQFFRRDLVAELKPNAVEQIDFLAG